MTRLGITTTNTGTGWDEAKTSLWFGCTQDNAMELKTRSAEGKQLSVRCVCEGELAKLELCSGLDESKRPNIHREARAHGPRIAAVEVKR